MSRLELFQKDLPFSARYMYHLIHVDYYYVDAFSCKHVQTCMTDLKLERKARLQFDFEIKSLEKSVLVFSNCHSKKKRERRKLIIFLEKLMMHCSWFSIT